MKFGVRECCDVVFRALSTQTIGKKKFYKNEPVLYFDTLKTSSLEGAATTVYAQGGRGNPRLLAWEGERTLTFTMEDALISPEGLNILTGAKLIEAETSSPIFTHQTEEIVYGDTGWDLTITNNGEVSGTLTLAKKPSQNTTVDSVVKYGKGIYVMIKDNNGNIITEPFTDKMKESTSTPAGYITASNNTLTINKSTEINKLKGITDFTDYSAIIDYYEEKESGVVEINIDADQFGGYYYIEAETLFKDQATGKDMPAIFVIPKGKVQSNFTFTMAGSGDPSTFTFTVDAFPGRVKGGNKDVLAAIQVITSQESGTDEVRELTEADKSTTYTI